MATIGTDLFCVVTLAAILVNNHNAKNITTTRVIVHISVNTKLG